MVAIEYWERHVRIAGIANFLLGVLLFFWPLLLAFPLGDSPLKRSLLVVGVLAAVCGAGRALLPRYNIWLSVANIIFGFWILLSPLEFRAEMTWPMAAATTAGGLALIMFAWWSVSQTIEARDLW
jgi:hypothetical protein